MLGEAQINAEIAEAENIAWAKASQRFPNIVRLPADIQKVIHTAFMAGFDSGVVWIQSLVNVRNEGEK